jgi:hypothetical protein
MKRSYKKTGGHQSHLPKSQVGHTTLMKDVRAGPEGYKQLAEPRRPRSTRCSGRTISPRRPIGNLRDSSYAVLRLPMHQGRRQSGHHGTSHLCHKPTHAL